jgi:hypothetical protein
LFSFGGLVGSASTSTSTSTTAPVLSVKFRERGFANHRKPHRQQPGSEFFFAGLIAKITLTLLADPERLPSEFRAGVTDPVTAFPVKFQERGFANHRKPHRQQPGSEFFFAGLIAKITLTLLADSERLPSEFRAGVADSFSTPPRPSRGRPGSRSLLFASPKRSNQEKGDREAAALRVPKSRSQSGGVPQTRFAQTCVTLIPCLTPAFGSCLNAEQVKVNCHININININSRS